MKSKKMNMRGGGEGVVRTGQVTQQNLIARKFAQKQKQIQNQQSNLYKQTIESVYNSAKPQPPPRPNRPKNTGRIYEMPSVYTEPKPKPNTNTVYEVPKSRQGRNTVNAYAINSI
jgi:hypothetical protein